MSMQMVMQETTVKKIIHYVSEQNVKLILESLNPILSFDIYQSKCDEKQLEDVCVSYGHQSSQQCVHNSNNCTDDNRYCIFNMENDL